MTRFFILVFMLPAMLFAQDITIEQCLEKTTANYPLVKQFGLIDKTTGYNLSNLYTGYYPQVSLSAKATYQSEVTEIPASLGQALSKVTGQNIQFSSVSKDQYQAMVEVSQLVWDGGAIKAGAKAVKAGAEADRQKTDVDLYALKDRVNNIYFGILLLDEQLIQNGLLKTDLTTNYNRVGSYLRNGVANQTDLDAIKVELINADQKEIELKSARRSYLAMLSAFTGMKLDENTRLSKPEQADMVLDTPSKRPELEMLNAQRNMYESQRDAIKASSMPRIGAFVQGGYGRPGLNMLNNEFSPFYIAGLNLKWNISSFYTKRNSLRKIDENQKMIEVQREAFLFNNNLSNIQQVNEYDRLKQVLKNDDEMIRLRNNIKKSSEAKVANGTLSVSDLIRDINAESNAKQTKAVHEIQLYSTVYQNKILLNK